ncbi:MAG TPA: alkaline phosphatase PhoX [Halomicronema sp.]
MSLKRRDLLMFLGGAASVSVVGGVLPSPISQNLKKLPFSPIKGPMPLLTDGVREKEQSKVYKNFEVVDDLVLPQGFTYQVIAAWGDKVGDSRFGYNNDYLSFVETASNEGYLCVNFEYISEKIWLETMQEVLGFRVPVEEVVAAINKTNKKEINAFALPENDPTKAKIREICKQALIDQGLGVISLRRKRDGSWERTFSKADRRVTGISGLEDNRYLKATGPAVAIFQKKQGLGYIDKLGERIIGTFGNCAGGTTPWGTMLSGEENFQAQVPEPVYADGTSANPSELGFNAESIDGQGNVFGLAGNKYGWVVELDPANPEDMGIKHTWLGRYRHEAVGVRVEAGKRLAFYSGCDRQGGHLYKFVSRDVVKNPTDKSTSSLLTNGMLYGAKFNADGTGNWIALKPDTAVNPDMPVDMVGGMLWLPLREKGKVGYLEVRENREIAEFKKKYKKLGDLYTGTAEEKQGAILIDAHYAATAAGVTCTARPEDTEISPDGSLYIAFTAGMSGKEGGPDQRIFKGPKGEVPYPFGWVMQVVEDGNDPAAMTFRWKMAATGGEPASGGLGFSNPDNLLIDRRSNLWMVTDMGGRSQNKAVSTRTGVELPQLLGLFGSNSLWWMPMVGELAGKAFLFGYGPVDSELTGPFFTRDEETLFLAVQHPGEVGGVRRGMAAETRKFVMRTTEGVEFSQSRVVPVGSNWPGKVVDGPAVPAVVAIRRVDGGMI